MSDKQFEDKVALIIGGSTGIGRATAVAFAQDRAKVAIAGRGKDRGNETEALVQQTGAEELFIETDVSIGSSVRSLVEQTS